MDTSDVVQVQCPYCFETVEVYVDPETAGEMVQDCEVCCNPWQLVVTRDDSGRVSVLAERIE
jgi:cysteine-rich CPXCG protein